MKYLMLSYTPIDTWNDTGDEPSDEALAAFAAYQQFIDELTASGEFVAAEGLSHPSTARTVRPSAAEVVVTDGPFAELKEVLASYAVIDCVGYERATEIAQRIVSTMGEPVELRPIMGEEFGADL